jgi:50S ribosomal protein L16 3-hydroxylase
LTSREVRSWLSKKPVSAAATAPIISDGNDTTTTMRKETLVVNDVDRYHPPLADWIRDEFRFLPNWRMDDGQISLAEMGGGIGPHVDDYDVFLIQMTGTRTWRIGRDVIGVREELDRTIDRMDVRILADRDDVDGGEDGGGRGMDEFTVHPGDVLYLPPRIAHCGTSLSDDCTTLSVGCRAPSVSDLVSKLAERLSSSMDDSAVRRYTDSDLLQGGVDTDSSGPMSSSPGELTRKAKERARRLVKDSLASIIDDDLWWDEFFGRYATEQKRARVDYPIPLEDSDADDDEWGNERSTVLKVLEGKGVLYQAEGIVFAYSSIPSKLCPGGTCHRCYVNGEMWQSETQSEDETNGLSSLFRIVSNHRRLDRSILLGYVRNDDQDTQNEHLSSEAISFLEELVSSGVLYGSTA